MTSPWRYNRPLRQQSQARKLPRWGRQPFCFSLPTPHLAIISAAYLNYLHGTEDFHFSKSSERSASFSDEKTIILLIRVLFRKPWKKKA
jgi:hypothetical protein